MEHFSIFFILLLSEITSVHSIEISPCAKWNNEGITVAGTGMSGSSPSQLNQPLGISIYNPTNALYIADHLNARIQKLSLNESGDDMVTVVSAVYFPLHVAVDDENNQPIIYISVSVDDRIEKWIPGATEPIQIGNNCYDCVALDIDQNRNVYITDTTNNRILKWSHDTNTTTIIAGDASQSDSYLNELKIPQGISVTRDGTTIYLSDTGNSRIQKLIVGEDFSVTVAGSQNGTASNETQFLNNPIGVLFDETSQVLYVADTYNHRIVRWTLGSDHGEIIAGSGIVGPATNQLNEPTDIKFDVEGNLYVCDSQNHRIQRFSLVENSICPSSSTGNFADKYTIIIGILFLSWLIQ